MRVAEELIGVQPLILTIDNGGTKTRFAQGGSSLGRIESYETPRDYATAIDKIAETASKTLDGRRPDAIGFSVAGAVKNGRIVQAGQLAEYGWVGLPFAEDVSAATGVPVENIILLNDCAAGANAERVTRLVLPSEQSLIIPSLPVEPLQLEDDEVGSFSVLSTGYGAALYTATGLGPDEPGHRFLKPGALCGDGQEGHAEAHISGSGIKRKFGKKGEAIPHDNPLWDEVKDDFHEAVASTIAHHAKNGRRIRVIGFTGSVALGGPDMLGGLQRDLRRHYGRQAPLIDPAVFGEESGLYGASFAASEVLRDGAAAVVFRNL